MRKYFLGMLFVCFALQANGPAKSIQEIEFELNTLEMQKRALKKQVDIDHRREMDLELQGQRQLLDYEWHALGKSLKEAELSEKKAKSREIQIEEIEKKIVELEAERDALLQKSN